MNATSHRWEQLYNQVPLCEVSYHFANLRNSPFMLTYLSTVLSLCPPDGRTLETGVGSGTGAIWLSLRGCCAEGIDYAPSVVERATQINALLEGSASFRVGDLFHLFADVTGISPATLLASPSVLVASHSARYQVIHHQGVLEHFTVPQIQAALAQQVALADHVVFSVPSVYYPFEPEFGDERLMPLAEWERILAPFDVAELRLYGDPQHGEREHLLCVLHGSEVTPELLALMEADKRPYLPGISAIVHTRNEEANIADCLQTLQGWTDEIIVCDMESEDKTVEIARQFTEQILHHPRIANFDRARNVSAMRARYAWVFYLDADERVPVGLGQALRHMVVEEQGEEEPPFAALHPPFRHFFAGHWLQSLYPGYTAPRLFRNGKFSFNTRLHSGAQVQGNATLFPANNPDLALVHHSFNSLSHYLEKLNRYTDGEAANMHKDGQPFHWQRAIRHFVQDFVGYYDRGQAGLKDGVHGFLWSFLSAFYRFEQHAKLYELRYREGRLTPAERAVPVSVEGMLEYALSVVRERPRPQATPLNVVAEGTEGAANIVWSGPLLDPSGYGEESRHLVWALEQTGTSVACQILPWNQDAPLTTEERSHLLALSQKPVARGFIQIVHNFPTLFERHPDAGLCIGRTLFETDRLPPAWVDACNRGDLDYICVPTEFNKATFRQSGIPEERLLVVPECFDPAPYAVPAPSTALSDNLRSLRSKGVTVFLSVFDWTRHKGWDALLSAFLTAFTEESDVCLVLKVWSTLGYSDEEIRRQAQEHIQKELGIDLLADGPVRWVFERIPQAELIALYQACDAFVLPSRGEGWGRPYMEAMACGLPSVATGWSGNTAFMNEANSYLLGYTLTGVPEAGWRELPTYQGHRWAEPDPEELVRILQQIHMEPEMARKRGAIGQEYVRIHCGYEAVGKQLRAVLETVISRKAGKVTLPTPSAADTPVVRWEGDFFQWHSLAHVNREICLRLQAKGAELAIVPSGHTHFPPTSQPRFAPLAPRAFAPLSQPAQVHVRHFFPPRLTPPAEGQFVLIQPWEYGYLPSQWIEPIQESVREVWCYSEYVRQVYLNSGIPAEKLQVVPLGVDTRTFHPDAPPYIFTTEAGADLWLTALAGMDKEARDKEEAEEELDGPFVFLFVGGTLERKGIDILIDAYLRAFSAYDDVCLVVKDTGTQTVYRGQNQQARLLQLATDPTRPRLIYLDTDLSEARLAGLYAACDCLVQPYRGEGFCLPALEAMACGLPVMVPAGGPTDDFVDETEGWRLEAEQKPMRVPKIGPYDCVGPCWQFEVSPDTLARKMRQVVARRKEARKRGIAARQRVENTWTWERTADIAWERITALQAEASIPTRVRPTSTSRVVTAKQSATAAHSPVLRLVGGEEHEDKNGITPGTVRKRPTVSLCMIVKNEERVLGDCLRSVKDHVDEIILVDTGSTDRTVEIALEHGAKVYHFPWCDDFSAARNVSLEHASGDWLFWMDADDTIPNECGKKLRELAMLAEDRVTGYLMQVHIPPAPGENGFTVVDHVKLFRNLPGMRFEGRIHEQILEPLYRLGGTVERTNLYVVHSGYDYSPEGQARKRERDLTILAKDLEERPDNPFVHFNIGMTHHHLKHHDTAIAALKRCLELSKPHESTVRKVYAMLSGCYYAKGEIGEAKEWLERGLSLFPLDPELLFRGGNIYKEAGDFSAAERCLTTLMAGGETGHIDSLDVSMRTYKANHNLALLYQETGRYAEAEAQWRAALTSNPKFVPSWLGLAELFLMTGRLEEARRVGEQIMEIDSEQANRLLARLRAIQSNP